MTRLAWVLVPLAVLSLANSSSAQSKAVATSGPAFYWEVHPDGRKADLYASGYHVGVWDADTERYFRVNVDGTRTGPVTPPWGPRKLNAQPASESKPEPKPEPKVETPAPKAPLPPREWYEELPSWAGYAIGGCVTLLISCIGLAVQFRKT
jgi:hypothetical protein